jgi:hypothetical protein
MKSLYFIESFKPNNPQKPLGNGLSNTRVVRADSVADAMEIVKNYCGEGFKPHNCAMVLTGPDFKGYKGRAIND